MPSLFLSHSSADKTFVEKLAKDLEGVGVNVWCSATRFLRNSDRIIEKK